MISNPIPQKIPEALRRDQEVFTFVDQLIKANFQMWSALNGNKDLTLISTTEVNAKVLGATELLKVPATKNFVPLFVVIRVKEFSAGSKSVQAIASFGGNSATYDDFLNSVTYTVAAANTYLIDQPNDAMALPIRAGDDSFSAIIETASNADTETWLVDLFGYYV